MAVALVALDATVRVLGPSGERATPLAGFHRLPSRERVERLVDADALGDKVTKAQARATLLLLTSFHTFQELRGAGHTTVRALLLWAHPCYRPDGEEYHKCPSIK